MGNFTLSLAPITVGLIVSLVACPFDSLSAFSICLLVIARVLP